MNLWGSLWASETEQDAVTVVDTPSIDLTLTGQQISASVVFGTTSGTVCQGNDVRLHSLAALHAAVLSL